MRVSYIIREQNVFTTAVSQIFEVCPTGHSNGYILQVDAFFYKMFSVNPFVFIKFHGFHNFNLQQSFVLGPPSVLI